MYGYGYSYPNNPQGNGLLGQYEAGVRSDGGSFAFPIDTGLASRLEGLGLLNASSLVNSCNAGKESVLYNLIPTPVQALDRFTVVRAGTKWVLNSSGVLAEVANNVPAFEFNTDGTYRGLLVEPAGTNLVTYSQAFDDASWGKQGAGTGIAPVVTPNDAVAPDGTTTADLIVFDRGVGNTITDNSQISKTPTVVSATAYTASFYLKAGTVGDVGKQIGIRGVARGAYQVVTLTNSWVRYSSAETSIDTSGSILIASRGTVTTDNTVSVHVWQGQLELGSVATSIIPTVASTANRVADSVTLTGASSLIGQSAGSAYMELEWRNDGVSRRMWTIDDVGTQNLRVSKLSGNTILFASTVSVGNNGSITSVPTYSGVVRTAFGYATNDMVAYVNGASVGTDTTVDIPPTSRITIGSAVGADHINGWIRSFALFPTRLSNAQLQALTS
jgi:hypothetical protein